MRTTTSLILGLLLIHLGQAVKFSGVKVKLGKAKCTCDITVIPKEPCTGKAKCDKKCSGKGGVELDGFTVDLQCRKGKCTVSNCEAEGGTEAPTGSGSEPGTITGSGSGSEPPMPITGSGSEPPMPITGSGSGEQPVPITGSGSGEQPVPITGSGSGEQPVPITGSGSGPVPLPPTGSGSGMPPTGSSMPCSCQCSCPEGGGACDCDCNCPVRSPQISCGSGFTKVCPMVEGTRCPDMMMAVCPGMGMETRSSMDRMSHEGEGCQCVPDFLLAMVPGMPPPGTIVAGRLAYSPEALNRAPEKATIMFGKKKCKCTVDCKCTKESCARSKITCDKKCSGTAKAVPIEGCGVVDAKAVKGKVKISKCTCGGDEPTGTGSGPVTLPPTGPGPLPITGSGSGPMPLPPTGSGSGPEPITGPRPACACVGVM